MGLLKIDPNAALDDAKQIDKIVEDITNEMAELNEAIRNTIPDGIRTTWSESVRENWESYYNDSIPAAMDDMKSSAVNLRLAVDESLRYSQE